jgi:hypothetical protein
MSLPKFKSNQLNSPLESVTLTNVIASGSFSGSYIGDGSGLTGVAGALPSGVVSGSSQLTSSYDVRYALSGSGGGLGNVVEDTTPQLGGNLDLNGNTISGSGNINFSGPITTNGTITSLNSITGFNLVSNTSISASQDIIARNITGSQILATNGLIKIYENGNAAVFFYNNNGSVIQGSFGSHIFAGKLTLNNQLSNTQFHLNDTGGSEINTNLYVIGNITSSNISATGNIIGRNGIIQNIQTPGGSNYVFTLDANNVAGPRVQLGQTSSLDSFFIIGAYGSKNNFDSKNRDLDLFTNNSSIRLNATTPNITVSGSMSVNSSISASNFQLNGSDLKYTIPTASNTTVIDLGYSGGHYLYMSSPSNATTFTTTNSRLAGWAKVRISGSASAPVVTGATFISGAVWNSSSSGSQQYLGIEYNGSIVEYFYLDI